MKNQPAEKGPALTGNALASEEVVAYLKEHPDFFDGHDDLLLELVIPHGRGASISLVERQVALLRERNTGLKNELDRLIDAARGNDATFMKSRRLILSLLEARTGIQLLDKLEKCLTREFKCDFYHLFIYADDEERINDWVELRPRDQLLAGISGLASSRKPVLGVLRDNENRFLFGPVEGKVGSAGVFPVRRRKEIALLALGSTSATHFQSGMGTLFTDFITDALARMIPRHTFN